MKKPEKKNDSPILLNNYKYPKDRDKIRENLKEEQLNYCAYTEKYITATDLMEIEHFNPEKKNTDDDSYLNWFLVMAKWNRCKGSNPRYRRHLPLMSPTDIKFEERVFFNEDSYQFLKGDIEADNFIKFLSLNQRELFVERKRYLNRMLEFYEDNGVEWLKKYLQRHPEEKMFVTALSKKIPHLFE